MVECRCELCWRGAALAGAIALTLAGCGGGAVRRAAALSLRPGRRGPLLVAPLPLAPSPGGCDVDTCGLRPCRFFVAPGTLVRPGVLVAPGLRRPCGTGMTGPQVLHVAAVMTGPQLSDVAADTRATFRSRSS